MYSTPEAGAAVTAGAGAKYSSTDTGTANTTSSAAINCPPAQALRTLQEQFR